MTRRIFFKLLLTVVALLAITGFGAAYLVSRVTAENLRADLRQSLTEKTLLARRLLESADPAQYQAIARRIAADAGARVTVIDRSGAVLADSDADPASMENHASRPEFAQALLGSPGESTRRSDTLGIELLYLAVPMRDGAVRLALKLSAIDARVAEVRGQILLMLLLALAPTILLAAYLSRKVSARISEIIGYSQRLAEGDFQSDLPVKRDDELGVLAETLRTTGLRLRSLFEQIQDERARFAAAVNGIGEGVLVVDKKMRIVLFNPAIERMVPNLKLYRGAPLSEWRREDVPTLFQRVLESGQPQTLDIQLDGPAERSWKVSCAPITSRKGKVQAVVAVFYDITEMDRVDRMRKDFVINVSHELRTPLAAILGYAETLLDGAIDDPKTNRRFMKILWQNAQRLAQLTSDLMTLSQIEVQTRHFHFDRHSVREILDDAAAAVVMSAEKKNIALHVDAVDSELAVDCDAGAVQQVLNNLLDNAIKYTPEGGQVRIGAELRGDRVEFYVRDTGIGIPPEHIPRLFERFYRVDKARSRELGGTGLGLAIVKHLVLAHYGSVRVESEPGRGSVFYFDLHTAMPELARAAEARQQALF